MPSLSGVGEHSNSSCSIVLEESASAAMVCCSSSPVLPGTEADNNCDAVSTLFIVNNRAAAMAQRRGRSASLLSVRNWRTGQRPHTVTPRRVLVRRPQVGLAFLRYCRHFSSSTPPARQWSVHTPRTEFVFGRSVPQTHRHRHGEQHADKATQQREKKRQCESIHHDGKQPTRKKRKKEMAPLNKLLASTASVHQRIVR